MDRSGFILYTINYLACIDFYRDVLGLEIMFDTDTLTCFKFGGSYLMVEIDDETADLPEPTSVKTCLRLNVPDVKSIADKIRANNIEVDYQEHSWGIIAKFHDPDGNLIGIKDSPTFDAQIAAYNSPDK